jgi:hypothetical protein
VTSEGATAAASFASSIGVGALTTSGTTRMHGPDSHFVDGDFDILTPFPSLLGDDTTDLDT